MKKVQKVLYKHINISVLHTAEDPSEITFHYLMGQAGRAPLNHFFRVLLYISYHFYAPG
jgi:hypothetical protein